ncbi:MAG: hypothetical protein WCO63_09080 [Bacteroidota bacterium]
MTLKKFLIALILLAIPFFSQAQKVAETDSTLRKSALVLLEKIRDNKPVDTLSKRVVVLGKAECERCQDIQRVFAEEGVVFEDYDVALDRRFVDRIVSYYMRRDKGEGFTVKYPLVIARGKIYNQIKDVKALAVDLKAMQQQHKK